MKVSEEEIWGIQTEKSFGNYIIRRINIEEWQVLEVGTRNILVEGTEVKVSKFMRRLK